MAVLDYLELVCNEQECDCLETVGICPWILIRLLPMLENIIVCKDFLLKGMVTNFSRFLLKVNNLNKVNELKINRYMEMQT